MSGVSLFVDPVEWLWSAINILVVVLVVWLVVRSVARRRTPDRALVERLAQLEARVEMLERMARS